MARDNQRDYGLPARRQETGLSRSGRPGFWNWDASPFTMMRQMQDEMDRMFNQVFGGQGLGGAGEGFGGMQAWAPSVDVQENPNEYIVRADVPGVEPEDLEVLCTDDQLIVRGETRREAESRDQGYLRSERRYGRFERALPLPGDVKPDQIQANFRNGVLELRMPKSEEAQQRARRIPIQGGRTMTGAKGGEVAGGQGQPASSGPTSTAPPSQSRPTSEGGSTAPDAAPGQSPQGQGGSQKR